MAAKKTRVVAWSWLLLAWWSPETASAFCRTTTCELTEDAAAPCLRDGDGCVTEGTPLTWGQSCARYAVQVDGSSAAGLDADEVQALVDEAFDRWVTAPCPEGGTPGFGVAFDGFVTCDRAQTVCGGPAANVSTVIFQDSQWPANYPSDAAGLTRVIADLSSGEIWDADLELNGARYSFDASNPDGVSLERVLTHEVGHFLGLSHSQVPGALMGIAYTSGTGLTLHEDDIAGICALYPPSEAGVACDTGGAAYDSCAEVDLSSGAQCGGEPEPEEEPTMAPAGDADSGGCSLAPSGASSPSGTLTLGLLAAAVGLNLRRKRRLRAV